MRYLTENLERRKSLLLYETVYQLWKSPVICLKFMSNVHSDRSCSLRTFKRRFLAVCVFGWRSIWESLCQMMLLYNTNKPFLCRLSGSFTFRSTISELSSPFCVIVIWFLRLHDHSLFVRQRCSWFAKRPAALLGLTDLSHAALARGHHVLVLRCTYTINKHRWCYTRDI